MKARIILTLSIIMICSWACLAHAESHESSQKTIKNVSVSVNLEERFGPVVAQKAEEFIKKFDIPFLAMTSALERMDAQQKGMFEDAILIALEAKSKDLAELRQEVVKYQADVPTVQKLRIAAMASLDKGEFDQAEQIFLQAMHAGKAAILAQGYHTRKTYLATVSDAASSGRAARLQNSRKAYENSAKHFAEASELALPVDASLALKYREEQATSLYLLGQEFGNNEALQECIKQRTAILGLIDRKSSPQDWARLQTSLGTALRILGHRERDTERVKQALQAFQEALKEYTREHAPLDWALTQLYLGNSLSILSHLGNDIVHFEQAVQAYQEALKEYTRERMPLQWAKTQNNLGTALERLGELENDTNRIEQAIQAFQEALKERTRERVPLNWAITQHNLGNALMALGERESGTERLEQAVQAYLRASSVLLHSPVHSGMAQRNLTRSVEALKRRAQQNSSVKK